MKNFYFSKLIQIQQDNITVLQKDQLLLIEGPLGTSFLELPENVFFEKYGHNCRFFGLVTKKNLILTYCKLFLNKVRGVDLGFSEFLIINGVG
jgi:ribosomal protein L6P/L9E